jgi:2'-5' RNA ligase
MASLRLFAALDVPPAAAAQLRPLRDAPEAEALAVRWTPPTNYHVTLRFIGTASEDDAVRYAEALSGLAAPGFEARVEGLTVFPSRTQPRVLVGHVRPADAARRVFAAVDAALRGAGLGPPDHAFRPHVTLGRFGDDADPEAVHAFLRSRTARTDAFLADAVALLESKRLPDGPCYVPRATFPLTMMAG